MLWGSSMRLHLTIFALIGLPALAAAGPIPVRTPVGSLPIDPAKSITHVEMTRVDFLPGQEMPRHMHPVPVVCFVTKGIFLVSIGTSPVRRVEIGETTLEPAGTVVHYFRNVSPNDSAQLNCALLAGPDDQVLSVMLPGK
jgi:quercetin dioxygenase-like cupin family protein